VMEPSKGEGGLPAGTAQQPANGGG